MALDFQNQLYEHKLGQERQLGLFDSIVMWTKGRYFYKGPDGQYFRLGGPHCLHCNYSVCHGSV